MPVGLKHLHVLAEPMSCAAKAVQQAFEVQRRLRSGGRKLAYVIGAGQIGLLTTLDPATARARSLHDRPRRSACTRNPKSSKGWGRHYVSTKQKSLEAARRQVGKADLIIDATGSQRDRLRRDGSARPQRRAGLDEHHRRPRRTSKCPSDKVNLDWVLGNKLLVGSVNANRDHFEMGIRDLALGEVTWPGVIKRILTTPGPRPGQLPGNDATAGRGQGTRSRCMWTWRRGEGIQRSCCRSCSA